MTELGEILLAPRSLEANVNVADSTSEFEEAPRIVGQLHILDPNLPFGEGLKSVVASVAVYEQSDGAVAVQTRQVDRAISKGVTALHSNENEDALEPIGAQTDMLNPLALTEREAAVVAGWEVQGRASQAEQERAQVEDVEDTGFLGVPLGRVAAGTATGLAGIGGGLLVATPALAQQPNQVSSPPAKVAQPFEIASGNALDLIDSVTPDTSLTPAEEQECEKIAVTVVPYPGKKTGYTMLHAGIRPYTGGPRDHKVQTIKGRHFARELPDGSEPGYPDCSGIRRVEDQSYEMQSAQNRNKWITLGRERNAMSNRDPLGMEPVGSATLIPVGRESWMFNECPDGKHWLKVRMITTLLAKDIQTGQFLDEHKYVWPVQVVGNCAAAARSARIAGY